MRVTVSFFGGPRKYEMPRWGGREWEGIVPGPGCVAILARLFWPPISLTRPPSR